MSHGSEQGRLSKGKTIVVLCNVIQTTNFFDLFSEVGASRNENLDQIETWCDLFHFFDLDFDLAIVGLEEIPLTGVVPRLTIPALPRSINLSYWVMGVTKEPTPIRSWLVLWKTPVSDVAFVDGSSCGVVELKKFQFIGGYKMVRKCSKCHIYYPESDFTETQVPPASSNSILIFSVAKYHKKGKGFQRPL